MHLLLCLDGGYISLRLNLGLLYACLGIDLSGLNAGVWLRLMLLLILLELRA